MSEASGSVEPMWLHGIHLESRSFIVLARLAGLQLCFIFMVLVWLNDAPALMQLDGTGFYLRIACRLS